MPHFQLEKFGTWSVLQNKYGTPEKFFASYGSTLPATTKEEASTIINNDIVSIKSIQTYCNKHGFRDQSGKKLVVDGMLGGKTKYAQHCFLQTCLRKDGFTDDAGIKIKVDGDIGSKSKQAMKKVICKIADKNSQGSYVWVEPKSRGNIITYMQVITYCDADSYFGSDTKEAVLKYQASHGLTKDSIVGYKTLISTL